MVYEVDQSTSKLKMHIKIFVDIFNKRNHPSTHLHFLSDIGANRRRNFQIKKRVVLSPTRDDKGDYIDSGRDDNDD